MLKIKSSTSRAIEKITSHLLPCQINHDGPVNDSSKYWKPQTKEDGTHEAYLRGRRLQGKEVTLPTGYEGIITQDGGVQKLEVRDAMYEDEGEEEQEDVGVLNEVGSFDRVMLWEHEKIVEDDDVFVKGVTEWVGFAEAVSWPCAGGERTLMSVQLHKPGKQVEGVKD